MKIEVVISVWVDGLFKLMDRVEGVDFFEVEEKTGQKLGEMQGRMIRAEAERKRIAEDDDIPF